MFIPELGRVGARKLVLVLVCCTAALWASPCSARADSYLWNVDSGIKGEGLKGFVLDRHRGDSKLTLLLLRTFTDEHVWYGTLSQLDPERHKAQKLITSRSLSGLRAAAVLPVGSVVALIGQEVQLLERRSNDRLKEGKSILSSDTPISVSGGNALTRIVPETVATSENGNIYVGGHTHLGPNAPTEYGVWQLHKNHFNRWEAILAATGRSRPLLTSGLSGAAVLLNDTANSWYWREPISTNLVIKQGPSESSFPSGIAAEVPSISADALGNVILADKRSRRVLQLSSSGQLLMPVAGSGAQPNSNRTELTRALDSAITPTGVQFIPGGGYFVRNSPSQSDRRDAQLTFVGPDDQLEQLLAQQVTAAQVATSRGDIPSAREAVGSIVNNAQRSGDMSGAYWLIKKWRVQIALDTLKQFVGDKQFKKISRPARFGCC